MLKNHCPVPCIEVFPENLALTTSDCLWLQLFPQSRKQVTLGIIYRQPSKDITNDINLISNIK